MKKISLFSIIMAVVIGIVIVLAFLFPVKKMFQSKNDRLLERGLNDLSYEIRDYYRTNNKLPESLEALNLDNEDAKQIVDKDLVRYKIVATTVTPTTSNTQTGTSTTSSISKTITVKRTEVKYELCTTYAYANNNDYDSRYDNIDEYDTYLSAYSHPAGEVCYKLKTY